jgi:hypothetical protein
VPAGEHILRTANTAIAVDRVVLSSSVGNGRAGTVPDPVARVTTDEATHRVVEVTGASRPFWLVLAESRNDGWHATVDGHDVGPSRQVDGGANGWLVTPGPGSTTMRISLTWQPQRWVDLGLLLSAIAGAACIVLVVVGGRRSSPSIPDSGPAPELADPTVATGDALTWPVAVAVAGAAALVTAVFVHPLAALPVGAAAVVAARWRRGRILLTGGAVGGVALAGVFSVARVVHSHPAAGFGWVTAFEPAHRLVLVAVLFAVVDAGVEGVRTRRTATSVYDDPARHD